MGVSLSIARRLRHQMLRCALHDASVGHSGTNSGCFGCNCDHLVRREAPGLCQKSRRDCIFVDGAKGCFVPFHRNGILRAQIPFLWNGYAILFATVYTDIVPTGLLTQPRHLFSSVKKQDGARQGDKRSARCCKKVSGQLVKKGPKVL